MGATRFTPGPDSARDFRDALGRFTTGVTIITCKSEFGPLGITANSFASVSLDPPLVLWSPARASQRFQAFFAANQFAIHILERSQIDLCKRFTADGLDFSNVNLSETQQGTPFIPDALAVFDCRKHAVHEGGDHAIIVGEVFECFVKEGAPLVFSSGAYGNFVKDK